MFNREKIKTMQESHISQFLADSVILVPNVQPAQIDAQGALIGSRVVLAEPYESYSLISLARFAWDRK